MKKQSSLNAILISAMVTLVLVVGIGWAAVAMNWIHISSSPAGSRDAELDAKGSSLGKKGGDFICEVTISTPKDTLNSEPKVYNDMLIAGLEPEGKSGWYQGEYSISESRKGAMRMEGSKAFVSRPAMFERFGQMITQEEFTIDLNDGAFVQTLTFRDGTRRHMIKGVCAKYSKAPFQ